jgi:2-polyprenyl-3-methyl-5-hydroxy-6-metoxy-1,4-benzoquinol methylase
MSRKTQGKHWTHTLFVDNPELYLPFLEQADEERTTDEIEGLAWLFGEFGVPQNGRVLDVACGIGRHSIALSRLGYEVTGLDLSPLFIGKAREHAEKDGASATFVPGNVSNVAKLASQYGPFDAIISMFTSHGYYGRDADLDLFRQLRTLAAPNGVLIVLTANRDSIVQNFSPQGLAVAEPIRILQQRSMDLETSSIINDWEFYEWEDGEAIMRLRLEMDHRLYSLHEFKELVQESGWQYERGLGRVEGDEFKLGKLTFEAKDMWVVAKA